MQGRRLFLLSVLFLIASASYADLLFERRDRVGPEPVTRTETFEFAAPAGGEKVGLIYGAGVKTGSFTCRLEGPGGAVLMEVTVEQTGDVPEATLQNTQVFDAGEGSLRLVLTQTGYTGSWQVIATPVPEARAFVHFLPSGLLMMGVALAAFLAWARVRPGWRWFGAGALLWVVGVALKFAWAIPLNPIIVAKLESLLPFPGYLAAGSLYIGLLTGVFEIGLVWLVALWWRGMAVNSGRAVAVGVGAGALEAFLLGLLGFITMVSIAFLPGFPDAGRAATAAVAAMTPVFVLVGPVERIIAILCHVGSRTLVLFGVATRRPWLGWLGFVLMTLVDTVAGYAYLAGLMGAANMWWVEAAIVPFALLGLYATVWCVRRWPVASAGSPGAELTAGEGASILPERQ